MKLRTGYRVLVNGTSKLAGMIRVVMRKYAKQMGYDTTFLFSHAGTIVKFDDDIRIIESVANGLVPNELAEAYNLSNCDIMIVGPRIPYTEEEEKRIRHYALDLIAVNNFYQYWSLFCWLAYVYIAFRYKGKWYRLNIFGKGNKFSNVCYESTYLIAKDVRPQDFLGNAEQKTCFDLYDPIRDVIHYRYYIK